MTRFHVLLQSLLAALLAVSAAAATDEPLPLAVDAFDVNSPITNAPEHGGCFYLYGNALNALVSRRRLMLIADAALVAHHHASRRLTRSLQDTPGADRYDFGLKGMDW